MRDFIAIFLLTFSVRLLFAAEPEIQREQIEKDLVLELELKTPKIVRPGERVDVALILRNRSGDKTYPAKDPMHIPGTDGRYVHLKFTAGVQQGNEAPKPVAGW